MGGRVQQVFLCQRVLHPWVSVRRPPTFVADVADATHTTSKRECVLPVVTEQPRECASTAGRRSLTDQEPELFDTLVKRNGYKAP